MSPSTLGRIGPSIVFLLLLLLFFQVVHMDVKPLNISMDAQGELHVLDMGSFQPLGRKINKLMVTYAFSHPAVRSQRGHRGAVGTWDV